MNWASIKDTVGHAAPLLGTLLGGPAGAAVGTLIAGALGVEDNPAAVVAAIKDPDKAAELQRWAYEHQERLEAIRLETLRAELADKANARENHKDSRMPAVVTCAMTAILGGLIYALFVLALPEANKEVAYMLFGQASALWGASISYWVGTTRSSSDKNRLISAK